MTRDLVVVGAGPAGLATAIAAAGRGLSVTILERRPLPCDKACGEGLMPAGVAALSRLGVLGLLDPADCAAFDAVRWVQEDGSHVEVRLPGGGGLGVRRTALGRALVGRARALGVRVRETCALRDCRPTARGWWLETDGGALHPRMLVAADGLASPLRRAMGLEIPAPGPRRFGLRRHYRIAPWAPRVEVHLSDGVEAYVTPAGRRRVGVAFLWTEGATTSADFDTLLARFPALVARLGGATADSLVRGAGPMARAARAQVADRFALVGDAAGYVDALTGEGVSLALRCAESLGEVLPAALRVGASRASLLPYQRTFRRRYRRYAVVTRAMLALTARPRLRRRVIGGLAVRPSFLDGLVARALA